MLFKNAMRVLLMLVCWRAVAMSATPVPPLKGERLKVARQMVRVAQLNLYHGVFYIAPQHWRDDIRDDVVYLQTPQPSTMAPNRSIVACWVFRKAEQKQPIVQMPDLERLPRKEAVARIQKAGLQLTKPAAVKVVDAGDDNALVIDQYPRPGQSVYQRTSVHLIIARK